MVDRRLIRACAFYIPCRFISLNMNQRTLLLCCLLLSVSAVKPKEPRKITLEDIEKENSVKRSKQSTQKVAVPAKSPTQYGFVPTKTLGDYIRNEPKLTYFNTQRTLEYTRPTNNKVSAGKQKYNQQPLQYSSSPQAQSQKYIVPQAYTVNILPEAQNQYPQNEDVQYVADNGIVGGQTEPQQYYNPQYIYLQQYTSPSTAVQKVVDPKDAVQYVMYVPVVQQNQKHSNTDYADGTSSQQQPYQTDSYQTSQAYPVQQVPAYDNQGNDQGASHQQAVQQIQYISPKYIKNENAFVKREPKSLLDSYVPSYLQLRYYNQVHQNAIRDTVKVPQVFTVKENSAEQSVVSNRYSPVGSYINYNYNH